MRIISIEPTPSPNTMKLNMSERVERGKTYTRENRQSAPAYIQKLLDIQGVKSVFQTADFIAIDRVPNGDWKRILAEARQAFGDAAGETALSEQGMADGFGEVRVFVQMFRRIPMQIRAKTEMEEARESLSKRFVDAAMEAGMASPNLIKERSLKEWGIRYGDPKDIAQEVMAELEASYDDQRLRQLKEQALSEGYDEASVPDRSKLAPEQVAAMLNEADWRKRYAAFERLEASEDALDVIAKALRDAHASVRRLAVVYLGEIKGEKAMPLLYEALKDASASVRRTAGDTLSDIGDPAATPHMIEALKDANKLVRWRAARFLYEAGDESAIEALEEAVRDPEFEVSLQAGIALERIRGGGEAEGTVWQQMTKMREQQSE